jgi:hypothetical protein
MELKVAYALNVVKDAAQKMKVGRLQSAINRMICHRFCPCFCPYLQSTLDCAAFLHRKGVRLAGYSIYSCLKLALIQLAVESAGGQQVFVRALLDDVSISHDQDQIGIAGVR